MATYIELLMIASSNSDLYQRVRVACAITAEVIRTESDTTPNHANRMLWAKGAFQNPANEADHMLWPVLTQHQSATTAEINDLSEAAVQAAVAAAVDVFAIGI